MIYLRGQDPWRQIIGLPADKPGQLGATDLCFTSSLEALDELWGRKGLANHFLATRRFLDDLAASTAAHRLPVIYLMDIPVPSGSCVRSTEVRQRVVNAMSDAFASRGMTFVDWNVAVLAAMGKKDPAALVALRGFEKTVPGGHLNHHGHEVFATALVDVVSQHIPNAQPADPRR